MLRKNQQGGARSMGILLTQVASFGFLIVAVAAVLFVILSDLHGYFVIEDGNHVDGFYDDYPDRLRPILACYRAAFEALEETVEGNKPLPPGGFLAVPEEGDVVNQCSLEEAT